MCQHEVMMHRQAQKGCRQQRDEQRRTAETWVSTAHEQVVALHVQFPLCPLFCSCVYWCCRLGAPPSLFRQQSLAHFHATYTPAHTHTCSEPSLFRGREEGAGVEGGPRSLKKNKQSSFRSYALLCVYFCGLSTVCCGEKKRRRQPYNTYGSLSKWQGREGNGP